VNYSNCGPQYSDFYFPYTQGYGYTIQSGDQLIFEQYQPTGVVGGMYISLPMERRCWATPMTRGLVESIMPILLALDT
jgi:hypothetical protein